MVPGQQERCRAEQRDTHQAELKQRPPVRDTQRLRLQTISRMLKKACVGTAILFVRTAEHFPHHADKGQRTFITNAVEHAVGLFARTQHAFFTQDGKML